VPRYLWRQAAIDAAESGGAALSLDDRRWFASMLRVVWFAGYVRETWSAARLKGSRSFELRGSRGLGERDPSLAPRSASLSGERNPSPAPRSASLSGERNSAKSAQVAPGR